MGLLLGDLEVDALFEEVSDTVEHGDLTAVLHVVGLRLELRDTLVDGVAEAVRDGLAVADVVVLAAELLEPERVRSVDRDAREERDDRSEWDGELVDDALRLKVSDAVTLAGLDADAQPDKLKGALPHAAAVREPDAEECKDCDKLVDAEVLRDRALVMLARALRLLLLETRDEDVDRALRLSDEQDVGDKDTRLEVLLRAELVVDREAATYVADIERDGPCVLLRPELADLTDTEAELLEDELRLTVGADVPERDAPGVTDSERVRSGVADAELELLVHEEIDELAVVLRELLTLADARLGVSEPKAADSVGGCVSETGTVLETGAESLVDALEERLDEWQAETLRD